MDRENNQLRYGALSQPIDSCDEPIALFDITVSPFAPPDEPQTVSFSFAADIADGDEL